MIIPVLVSGHAEREVADQEHVVRLEVAVDHALVVRRLDGFAQALADVDDRCRFERADPLDVGVQIEPRQVLADDVLPALRCAANIVGADDARMVDRGGGLRLALEAQLQIGVHRQIRVQHLDGEALVRQPRVARLVHAAHAALAEDVVHDERVVQRRPDQRVRWLRGHGQAAPRGSALVERSIPGPGAGVGALRTLCAFDLAGQRARFLGSDNAEFRSVIKGRPGRMAPSG
jgi:hypothetical protein